jgi:hypothetical protein
MHSVRLLPPLRLHRALSRRQKPGGIRHQAQTLPPGGFARNDVEFIDPTGVDHNALGSRLNKALYNYMYGIGLDANVRSWFDMPVLKTKVPKDFHSEGFSPSLKAEE